MGKGAAYKESFSKKLARYDIWSLVEGLASKGKRLVLAGQGGDVAHLNSRGYGAADIVAYDTCEKQLEVARARCAGATYVRGDVAEWRDFSSTPPFTAAFLDFCATINPALAQCAARVGNVLRAGTICECHTARGVLVVEFLKGRENYRKSIMAIGGGQVTGDTRESRHAWRAALKNALLGRAPFLGVLDSLKEHYPDADPTRVRLAIICEALRLSGLEVAPRAVFEYKSNASPMMAVVFTVETCYVNTYWTLGAFKFFAPQGLVTDAYATWKSYYLYDATDSFDEFRYPNDCAGPFPRWEDVMWLRYSEPEAARRVRDLCVSGTVPPMAFNVTKAQATAWKSVATRLGGSGRVLGLGAIRVPADE